ncbi:MAG: DNA mismatch repair protein MutS [Nitrosomonas sp. PRO4]|nr:DNA mismatch repair protein MutS [Nitrosomonas sp. PRO4]
MSNNSSSNEDSELALFHAAMQGVEPLTANNKAIICKPKVPPIPRRGNIFLEETEHGTLSDHIAITIEQGDDWSFIRPGMSHQTLRRLRRGHWKIQGNLDLHGLTRDQARQELSVFLAVCIQNKFRCVRIIHGKGLGSKNREPVLKTRIGNWLMQFNEVLAFCQAKPEDGGSGAVLVLLKINM